MFKILLVEDNKADVELISRLLRHEKDMQVLVAGTGAEALESLEREPISCLLLDYCLPDTNGLELLHILRVRFPAMRIILLTGHEDRHLFLGASMLGVSSCISKDELTEDLLTRTIRWSSRPQRSPSPSLPIRFFSGFSSIEVYQTLIETMNEGVIVADSQHIVVFVNPRMGEIVGCPATDLFGKGVSSLLTPESIPKFLEEWKNTISGKASRYDCELLSSSSSPIPVLISQTASYGRNREIIGGLLMISDISRQKEIERRLEQLSITDGLTGLFNRRHFQALIGVEFQKALRYQHPLSCLMIDIDYFKAMNDTIGHLFGDHVLQEIGRRILKEIRGHDILARYGGDELVLLLPSISSDHAVELAERVRSSVADNPVSYEGQGHKISVSIGIAGIDNSRVTSPTDLLRFADRALYEAKASGRNKVSVWM